MLRRPRAFIGKPSLRPQPSWRATAWPKAVCRILAGLLLCAAPAAGAQVVEGAYDIWLLVDTSEHVLEVYFDDIPVLRFDDIRIGSRGAAPVRREGDKTTPLGQFRITHINRNSRFHIFMGLDYPTRAHIDKALELGYIDADTHAQLLQRSAGAARPPQNTPLGGHIGIHGLGQGDPEIHAEYDWTQGCIALTNHQIERLTNYVRVGTRVLIR